MCAKKTKKKTEKKKISKTNLSRHSAKCICICENVSVACCSSRVLGFVETSLPLAWSRARVRAKIWRTKRDGENEKKPKKEKKMYEENCEIQNGK